MRQYHRLLKQILGDRREANPDVGFVMPAFKPNRTGIDTISVFDGHYQHDLATGFPLLTTKKMFTRGTFHELIWFLRGSRNIKYLVDNDVGIWNGNAHAHYQKHHKSAAGILTLDEYIEKIKTDDDFAKRFGDIGPVYGFQWRHFQGVDDTTGEVVEHDQLTTIVETLRRDPTNRKMVMTAWNPPQLKDMALDPCHVLYNFNVMRRADGQDELRGYMFQRSCDTFLGVPFNMSTTAALIQVVAGQLGLPAGIMGHTLADMHLYCGDGAEVGGRGAWYEKHIPELSDRVTQAASPADYLDIRNWVQTSAPDEVKVGFDHIPQALEQLSREPKLLSTLTVADKPFDELEIGDFSLEGYEHHPKLIGQMAV